MNATVTIRAATREDLPGILALYAQPGYDDGKVLEIADAVAIFEKMSTYPFYKLHVAEQDGRILGTYALLVMDNIGHLGTPSAIVESVAVAPECQGLGIGKRMMGHAMAEAAQAGCYKLALSSNIKRVMAHEFYDKLGFRRHGLSFVVEAGPHHE